MGSIEADKQGVVVRIDPRRCIANAKCTTAAPGIYVLDEETGVAVLENEESATLQQLFAGARACPTQAIVFGNVNDPESRVAQLKASPLNYGLLAELGTRPRTTYLARLRNPNPMLAGKTENRG